MIEWQGYFFFQTIIILLVVHTSKTEKANPSYFFRLWCILNVAPWANPLTLAIVGKSGLLKKRFHWTVWQFTHFTRNRQAAFGIFGRRVGLLLLLLAIAVYMCFRSRAGAYSACPLQPMFYSGHWRVQCINF